MKSSKSHKCAFSTVMHARIKFHDSMNSELATQETSLSNFPEQPDLGLTLTPRSVLACEMEGIRVEDIVYCPVEHFEDAESSPRLAKLRYDFHEAKRQDLVGVARTSYERLLNESSSSKIRSLSQVPKTSIAAINMEKEKLARYQQSEKRWLESCLNQELRYLRQMEADDKDWESGIRKDHAGRMKEEVKRVKELNERRRKIEEQKERVMLAQQELERERAKQVLLQHQEDARQEEERELARKRAAEKRIEQEAEARRQKELERKQREDESWEAKQLAIAKLHAAEEQRLKIIAHNKNAIRRKIHERLSDQEARVVKSIEKSQLLENERKNAIISKLVYEKERDQKLLHSRQSQSELIAKKSLHQLIRLRTMHEENEKKLDQKRRSILHQQSSTNQRVAAHEQNQQRYYEYRKELERLRSRNKELNVERQRRKEKYLRDMYAARVIEKDAKVETMNAQRQRLWEQRRRAASMSQQTRDHVKQLILDMRMKSKMDPERLQEYIDVALNGDRMDPLIIDDPKDEPLSIEPISVILAAASPRSYKRSPVGIINEQKSPREPVTSPVDHEPVDMPLTEPVIAKSILTEALSVDRLHETPISPMVGLSTFIDPSADQTVPSPGEHASSPSHEPEVRTQSVTPASVRAPTATSRPPSVRVLTPTSNPTPVRVQTPTSKPLSVRVSSQHSSPRVRTPSPLDKIPSHHSSPRVMTSDLPNSPRVSSPRPVDPKESEKLLDLAEEIRQDAANETSNVDAFLARETAIADQEELQFTKSEGELGPSEQITN